jgi:hypothetical protein
MLGKEVSSLKTIYRYSRLSVTKCSLQEMYLW